MAPTGRADDGVLDGATTDEGRPRAVGAMSTYIDVVVFLAIAAFVPFAYARASRTVADRFGISLEGWPWWVGLVSTIAGIAVIVLLLRARPALFILAALLAVNSWFLLRPRGGSRPGR